MAENLDKTTGKKTAEKKVGAAKKPVAAKAAEKKTPEQKANSVATAENAPAVTAMDVTAKQRYRMVAEAAYYRAESNHFMSDPVRDWIEAEGDIAALLDGKK